MKEQNELTFEEYKNFINKNLEQKKFNYIFAKLSVIETVLIKNNLVSQKEFDECTEFITDKIIKALYDKLSESDKNIIKIL
jgi:hypothetical protein